MSTPVRFDNGAAYADYMGTWSQLVGEAFLDWLDPPHGLAWLDVGCGNGAFTELVAARCVPAALSGIDPSAAMLEAARGRELLRAADLQLGNAMALPHGNASFDIAVMPLVLFFVPQPTLGVAEMARVVRPGGIVAAYAWDMDGGGFPYDIVHTQMHELGIEVPSPPSPQASRLDVMQALWQQAGMDGIEVRQFSAHRTYADFAQYWSIVRGGPSVSAALGAALPAQVTELQRRLHALLPAAQDGSITCSARANAVRGRR